MSMGMSLKDAKVIVTMRLVNAAELMGGLNIRGADASCVPMTKLLETSDHFRLQSLARSVDKFDWLVLTSKNAAEFFLRELDSTLGRDVKIATVGAQTAKVVRALGWRVDHVASGKGSIALIDELETVFGLTGKSILYPTSNLVGRSLKDRAQEAGASGVTIVEAYRIAPPDVSPDDPALSTDHIYVFASSSAVINFIDVNNISEHLQEISAVAIGDSTASTLASAGVKQIFKAVSPDTGGLIAAIENAWTNKEKRG